MKHSPAYYRYTRPWYAHEFWHRPGINLICAAWWLVAAMVVMVFDALRQKEYPLSYGSITEGKYMSSEAWNKEMAKLYRQSDQEWITELYLLAKQGR